MNGGPQTGPQRGGTTVRDPSAWQPARVITVEPVAEDLMVLSIELESAMWHRAGQYCEVRFPGEALQRAFSIVSPPIDAAADDPRLIAIGIKVLPGGSLTPRLAACRPGSPLEARGPLGQAFPWVPEHGPSLALFGAGVGITPLISMFEYHRRCFPGMPALFHVSARSPDHLFRFESYRNVISARFTAAEGRIDANGVTGLIERFPNPRDVNVRVCGSGGFIRLVVTAVLRFGCDPARVRSEGFA